MKKNIVLIGFMGAGKSFISKCLSKKLGLPVLSTDELIEKAEGRPVSEIFRKNGEQYFREIEAKIIAEVAKEKAGIIDCGGGVVLDPENIRVLRENGIIFYLSTTSKEIFRRVKNQGHRPLLQTTDPMSKIEELLLKRRPLYEKADCVVVTDGRSSTQICMDIISFLKQKGQDVD